MKNIVITGLQKLTLLDFPGKVACTLFTKGCNMRCPFCHNASLVVRADEQQPYNNEELLAFLQNRFGLLDGVAITGGEPTLWPGLYDFIAEVKKIGYEVKLDTNGTRPEVIKKLVADKMVDYVAMDIKNCREKYGSTIGFDENYDLSPIDESIAFLMEGKIDFEFRTTVTKQYHTAEDIIKIGEWIRGNEKYFLQQFKDSGDIIGEGLSEYNKEEMEALLDGIRHFVPNAQVRGV
jgi:pyruvate formate lyase activating enzyme